jgi:hypothetical protein
VLITICLPEALMGASASLIFFEMGSSRYLIVKVKNTYLLGLSYPL